MTHAFPTPTGPQTRPSCAVQGVVLTFTGCFFALETSG